MPCYLKYSIISACFFIGCTHFSNIAYWGYCFVLTRSNTMRKLKTDINEQILAFYLKKKKKSEFLKCSVLDTLCCYANMNKRFLMYFNNTDYILKVPRPEFHCCLISMKFQQHEVHLHMQSRNFVGHTSYCGKLARFWFLTLVLRLNPDIHCLCKQCRSRSVGF